MSGSPIYELLERSLERFTDRRLLICGDILDEQLLKLTRYTKSATVLVDNYITAQAMAALLGQTLDSSCEQNINYKHINICYAPLESAKLEKFDTLLLILGKNKQLTLKLLSNLQAHLEPNSLIYIAGENAGGGKSAGSLLNPTGESFKLDLARKCTLFMAQYQQPFPEWQQDKPISVGACGFKFKLYQDPTVFSQGRLDEGTAMLLYAIRDANITHKALDLGCGCGIVGLCLKRLGHLEVTASDVSAQALYLSSKNAELNDIEGINYQSADMLKELDSFDLIAVNPPFHRGLATTTAPTIRMIQEAPAHLNQGGAMYLVANSHLPYDKYLKEAFSSISIVKENPRYKVYKCLV